MPNIMMFGFTEDQYQKKKKIINQTMQELYLGNDAVTTRVVSEVESCDSKQTQMPYIVVRSTGGLEEINKIVEALKTKKIGVDCEKEPLPPGGFIPAKEMQ